MQMAVILKSHLKPQWKEYQTGYVIHNDVCTRDTWLYENRIHTKPRTSAMSCSILHLMYLIFDIKVR